MVKAAHNLFTNRQPYTVEYAYDHQGRMVWKQVSANAVALSTRTLLWDNYNIVQETIHSTVPSIQSSTNLYVWGLDIAEQSGAGLPRHSAPGASAGGIGGLLAASLDGTTALYTYDANGNVGQLVGTDGELLAHYEYSPFGEMVVSTGPLAKANPFRFSTKHWDDLIGLGYWGYRWYSPGMGRWLSRDPIEERGGLNLHCLLWNDPVNFVDVLGLVDWRSQSTSHVTDMGAMGSAGNVQSYPGGPQWAYEARTLAVAGADWTIRVFCRCREQGGPWVISYVRVTFTPVVHYRTSYESDEQRRWVREREQDHVGDYRWWGRNEGQTVVANFERQHFGDTFANRETCVNTLQPQVGPLLTASFATIVGRTIRSWDDPGQHTWPGPRNPPQPPRGGNP